MIDRVLPFLRVIFVVFVSLFLTTLLLPIVIGLFIAIFNLKPQALFGAYLFIFGYLIFQIAKNYYYLIGLTVLLLYCERYRFLDRFKLKKFAGPIFYLFLVFMYAVTFAFYNTKAQVLNYTGHRDWKADIQATQFWGSESLGDLSRDLCAQLEQEWSSQSLDLETTQKEIDRLATAANLKLATENNYVQRGYITYYFEVRNQQEDITDLKNKISSLMQANGIMGTFYWLNKAWYEENWLGKTTHRFTLMEYEEPFILIRFETLFPVLDDYTTKNILKTPPEHVLKVTDKAGLVFVKSERLDPISYTYSVPVPFFQTIGGNYNVIFKLWGVKGKDGYKSLELREILCNWPRYSLKSSSPGIPPSKQVSYPSNPKEIPSCGEYYSWIRCQDNPSKKNCKRYEKGDPAPECKPLTINFSEEEYG